MIAKILAIARKDLRSTLRNVPALVMMLVAPLALAGLLGFAFGGGGSTFQISATKVAFADQDQAVAGQAGKPSGGALVGGILTGNGLKGVLAVTKTADAAAARRRVDDGKAAVAVIVPSGFSAALYGSGGSAAVELYENPTQQLGNAITTAVLRQTLLDFNGARAAAPVTRPWRRPRAPSSSPAAAWARRSSSRSARRAPGPAARAGTSASQARSWPA
jgi:ABC-2 type transport system permease protein